jgi:hypothetical protein
LNEATRFEDLPDFLDIKQLKEYLRIGYGTAYTLATGRVFQNGS